MTAIKFVFLVAILTLTSAYGLDCPSSIYYKNGNYLKSGNTYYYSNGNYAVSGSSIYYPNGNYLKSGSTYYYENGNYIKSGSTMYYPNGNYLKSGSNYYYSNGNYLNSGSTFYYKNGNYARSGSTLYRPDGSTTPFPVSLFEEIGTLGKLSAVVDTKSQNIEIDFHMAVNLPGVELEPIFEGEDFIFTHLLLNTGHENENVHIDIKKDGIECSLLGGHVEPGPTEFTLDSKAASVNVKVKNGANPAKVREAIQKALDSL